MSAAKRMLAGRAVHPIGLGCMNLSHAYGEPPAEAAARTVLERALTLGFDHFDTAALYGAGSNEVLVGNTLGAQRDRILLASKGGIDVVRGKRVIDGRPEALRRALENSLTRLRTDVIDLYYLHRWDKQVPIEDSVGELARMVAEGKVRALGLSEVSAATLRKAHAVHPIAAVQSEYSLVTRNVEIAVLEACAEIGAAFVAFSPLGRGFLTDTPLEPKKLAAKDIRRGFPRFQPPHFARNAALLDEYRAIARAAGCTGAQLALAWLLARSPHVHVIPGTTSIAHLAENYSAAEIRLDASLVARLDALINENTVSGPRYPATTQAEIDTEQFA